MKDDDIVVRGARLFFGLAAAIILCLLLMVWAAFGAPTPDWQFPCPKEEAPQLLE